jgi:hypothetical protein
MPDFSSLWCLMWLLWKQEFYKEFSNFSLRHGINHLVIIPLDQCGWSLFIIIQIIKFNFYSIFLINCYHYFINYHYNVNYYLVFTIKCEVLNHIIYHLVFERNQQFILNFSEIIINSVMFKSSFVPILNYRLPHSDNFYCFFKLKSCHPYYFILAYSKRFNMLH